MREQLRAVVTACAEPHVRVQVVPSCVGAYAGLNGPFVIADRGGPPMAGYLDNLLQGQVVSGPDEIAAMLAAWEAIQRRGTVTLAIGRPDQGSGRGMDLTGARWRKSTRSSGNGGACVEVADNLPGVVLVRDTKDRDGGALAFGPVAWAGLRQPREGDRSGRLIDPVRGEAPAGMVGASSWRCYSGDGRRSRNDAHAANPS